jgi:CIC family chloride channel protein
MISELKAGGEGEGEGGSLALLTALALAVGAISGAGVACFMLLLEQADQLRDALLVFAHAQGSEGIWLPVGACAAAAGI